MLTMVSTEDMAIDNVYWIWKYSKSSVELESHDDIVGYLRLGCNGEVRIPLKSMIQWEKD